MRSGLVVLIAAGAAMAVALPAAQAEDMTNPHPGWYVSGGGGVSFVDHTDNRTVGLDRPTFYNTGGVADLAVGKALSNGLRFELDYSYRDNSVDSVSNAAASGSAKVHSVLANIEYALPTHGWLIPYVGAGIGYGRMKYDGVAPFAGSSVDDTSGGLAYQLIAGVEHPITDHLSASLSYRYFSMPDTNFTTASGLGVDSNYASHAILVGLRWTFGGPERQMAQAAPPPAPMPAPAPAPKVEAPAPAPQPAPPRRFVIFFGWNQSTLTADARTVLARAAEAAKKGHVIRIELTGHADRSGPAAYNMKLSQRRADAAKAQLVRDGISASEIVTFAKGETDPLVPTADGVREPQNRRVEIVFVNK